MGRSGEGLYVKGREGLRGHRGLISPPGGSPPPPRPEEEIYFSVQNEADETCPNPYTVFLMSAALLGFHDSASSNSRGLSIT